MLEEVLVPLLIKPLVNIIADYSNSRSREFAEQLYQELWEGKMELLGELYDVEKDVLKESHHFWDHLSGEAQPALAFVHMLWETRKKHDKSKKTLDRFAELVGKKMPLAGYFVGQFAGGYPSSPLENISFDERPQALLNDRTWSESVRFVDYERIAELHYMLMQGNLPWLKKYIKRITWLWADWLYCFQFLHAVEPAFLLRFFDIHFIKQSSDDRRLFNETAPIAMGVEPDLSNALIAIARENDWEEPVAIKLEIVAKLADHKEAGGDVHMQPLKPVAQSLDALCSGVWFAASSTLKTVASEDGTQLHIAAGNVLCALSTQNQYYLHFRTFESNEMSTHAFDAGHSIKEKVQHGDVIAISWSSECPSFLTATVADRRLTQGDCFECLKAFCYAAREDGTFVAIVEHDRLVAIKQEPTRLAAAPSASGVKAETMDRRKDGRKRKERGGSEERTSKKPRKERGDKQSRKRRQRRARRPSRGCDELQES